MNRNVVCGAGSFDDNEGTALYAHTDGFDVASGASADASHDDFELDAPDALQKHVLVHDVMEVQPAQICVEEI